MESGLPFVSLWCAKSPDGDSILHVFTGEAHSSFPLPSIQPDPGAVEEFLPRLARPAPSADPSASWLLLLEPSLPESWLRLRWETLGFGGRPLSSQALVVRSATWQAHRVAAGKAVRYLNLFPDSDHPFLTLLQPLLQSGRLRTSRQTNLRTDMATASDLVIVAHGRESGLVDAEEKAFDIPVSHPMPDRIWLLACNVGSAMDELAKRLLSQGCRTVIAATGDLSAPAMEALIHGVFSGVQAVDEQVTWLARTQLPSSNDGGCHGLTVWGHVDIDPSPCVAWNRLTWDNEHGAGRRPPLDDETTREEFMEAHALAMAPATWPLTRTWMLPPLLWLAEKHHHPAMANLEQEIGETTSPEAIASLAAAARRVGNYVNTAKYLSLGLNSPNLHVRQRADYLGALANLFIDLDLPEAAAAAIELHEGCHHDSVHDQQMADFRRLDWQSRTQARRGRMDIALDLMTAKRNKAGPDIGRELAGQLYLSAWGGIANQVPANIAAAFASEVSARLSGTSPEEVNSGNETAAYLLRALAAYAWVANDSESLKLATSWLSHAETRLAGEDPGPWAYTIAYLHLADAARPESFERAVNALERARYFLEAASLSGFASRGDECRGLLLRFQHRRETIFSKMKDTVGLDIARAHAELLARTKTESDAGHVPKSAALQGTLPL